MADPLATKLVFRNKRNIPFDFVDGIYVEGRRLVLNLDGSIAVNVPTAADYISEQEENRLKQGNDGKLYVKDNFDPDPVAYYLLAKN